MKTTLGPRLGKILFQTLFAAALVAAMVFADHAEADTIRGILINDSTSDLKLVLKEHPTPLTIQTRPSVMNSLRKLKNGDEVTGTGIVRIETGKVEIETVQSVGLQELVGTWQSSRWEIFEFFDFNRLNLYLPKEADNGDVVLTKTHELSYYISPHGGDQFSLFIVDPKRVMLGTIQISESRKITITVFNSETGKASENISLSPLTLK